MLSYRVGVFMRVGHARIEFEILPILRRPPHHLCDLCHSIVRGAHEHFYPGIAGGHQGFHDRLDLGELHRLLASLFLGHMIDTEELIVTKQYPVHHTCPLSLVNHSGSRGFSRSILSARQSKSSPCSEWDCRADRSYAASTPRCRLRSINRAYRQIAQPCAAGARSCAHPDWRAWAASASAGRFPEPERSNQSRRERQTGHRPKGVPYRSRAEGEI